MAIEPPPSGRMKQIAATFRMTRKADPLFPLLFLGVFVGVLAAFVLVGLLVGHWIIFTIFGVAFAFLASTAFFGRRAQRAAYKQISDQPGAAAAVLQSIRRGWTVTPAVAVNRNQDIVHRAVGRPGIVLVGEGDRVSSLIAQEKKKLSRVVPDVPVYEFLVGSGEGRVPLMKIQRNLMKLPRNIRPAQVSEVERRLKALGGMNVAMPKGPLPKGARMPRPPQPRGR